MSVITIFGGLFCRQEQVAEKISEITGCRIVSQDQVVAAAAELSGVSESKVERAFTAKTSVFNKFTHEKECSIAHLKLALARILSEDNLLLEGFCSHLIPGSISHVLRVCMIARMDDRLKTAMKTSDISLKEATRKIRKADEDAAVWTDLILSTTDPWDESLYDMIIPMDSTRVDDAAGLVIKHAASNVLQYTETSELAVKDFLLAAKTEVALSKEGHDVTVEASAGKVAITINKHVLMLSRLEEELSEIARTIPSVSEVVTRTGGGYHQSTIYRKHDFRVPSKVLLVDDEREFVQTLSERLMLRDMGSATVYDGQSALDLIENDEPEVMIIDLKMPGIDGIEVIRKVKSTRPDIEIIVLTGHGSEEDRKRCMDLGAFAYLQKPVDIELLSKTLKKAHEKVQHYKKETGAEICR